MSLNNNLIDACVVVGMDEQTGLLPVPNPSSRSERDGIGLDDELGPYQLNVLAVLTGTTAFFPCQQTEISGNVSLSERIIRPVGSAYSRHLTFSGVDLLLAT